MSKWMMHPDLPDDQWIEAPDEASAHYGAAGWVPVPDDVLAARDADEAHALAVADARMAGLPEPERGDAPAVADEAASDPAPDPAADAPQTKAAPRARAATKTAKPDADPAADADTEGE